MASTTARAGRTAGPATGMDTARTWAVLAAAVLQAVAGSLGGSGTFGESQRVLSDRYPSLVTPATVAFSVWGLIYLALLVYAVYQSLPGQRSRPVHRATGWLFVATAALNAGWIVVFSQELLGTAQLLIVALLVTLAVVLHRLAAFPAEGVADRALLHGPLAFYTGWVPLATVAGFSVTLTYWGAPLGPVTAAALLGAGVLAAGVATRRTTATLPYAATAAWALVWIAVESATTGTVPVTVVAAIGVVAVVVAAALRAREGLRAAFG
ncbi:tryptophan-rich sensory protein [Pseudonocardia antarctica]|uniref:Tryptophan-rich sensory protein n=1 Tax=Pseudonocardia alni TaxID=33907 RepID=A0A852WA34_PSEA5|nr:tryptophan-rich sensory protein [Pseudonocardia antarctica]NYG02282.1 tryptophan-rich sensory protein [Pseudonocardia antarctica]